VAYRSNSYQVLTACEWASEVALTHAPNTEAERTALERLRGMLAEDPVTLLVDRALTRTGAGMLELVTAAESYAQLIRSSDADVIDARDRIVEACKQYRRNPMGGV
jgi:hypothetical protein